MDLFISLAIPFLLFEITVAAFSERYHRYLDEVVSRAKNRRYLDKDKPFIFFQFFYTVWTIIGLFTSHWPLFLSIIFLSTISSIISKSIVDEEGKVKMRRSDAVLTTILLITLLINLI
jgi:hypothetical protein